MHSVITNYTVNIYDLNFRIKVSSRRKEFIVIKMNKKNTVLNN